MSLQFLFDVFLPVMAFAIGACIGSFLNVVIYRVPNGLSVNEPRRSFCPTCKTQIPIWLNIPLFTWLMLRGKCKWCHSPIAFRYFLVELLTAICFLTLFKHGIAPYDLQGVVALWIFAALLIAATFIDFDHFIIPDSITIGGTVVGLIASFAVPALHGPTLNWWQGGLQGVIGAAVGFGFLWLIVLMGKMMFGKIHHRWEEPVDFEISQPDGEDSPIYIKLGEHTYQWEDVFFRKWDRLELDTKELAFDDEPKEFQTFRVLGDALELDGARVEIESVKKVSGRITSAVVPREAMGFGDVKFMAMIGAFLGWQAAIFTIFAASVAGAIIGLLQKSLFREQWSRPLPFGPYLALGAFLWVFTGPAIWFWYLAMLRRGMGHG